MLNSLKKLCLIVITLVTISACDSGSSNTESTQQSSNNNSSTGTPVVISQQIEVATAASPVPGTYVGKIAVELLCNNAGGSSGNGCSVTYYTKDGTEPDQSSTGYVGPVEIEVDTTFKFFSVSTTGFIEAIKTVDYTIQPALAVTRASIPSGDYQTVLSIELICETGTSIACGNTFYTTDGSTPTEESTQYSDPVILNKNTTLKFFSMNQAGISETMKTESYTFSPEFTNTTASVPSGTYTSAITVTLNCSAPQQQPCGSTRFTIDGTEPTISSNTYSTPLKLDTNTILKFFSTSLSGFAEPVKTESYDFEIDTDQDGLSDLDEINIYHTSPTIMDTDGDGINDGKEVLEFGFNPLANRFRFNPLIADLPAIKIDIETVPEVVIRYTNKTSESKSVSNAAGGKTVSTSTAADTGGVSVSLSAETAIGATGGVKVKGTVTGSYSHTSTESNSNWQSWNEINKDSSSVTNSSNGGSIRVGVNIENISNLSFTLEHVSMGISKSLGDGTIQPVAAMTFGGASSFPKTSFAPGQKSGILLFANENLDLGTSLALLKDLRTIVSPQLMEISDASGQPLAFNQENVGARTAFIRIDYGTSLKLEQYHVATLANGNGSTNLQDVLTNTLVIPFIDNGNGITSVRNITEDSSLNAKWLVIVEHDSGQSPIGITKYDTSVAAYDLATIPVFAGDKIALVYLIDADGDGVGIREETLAGTDPSKMDTDGDGLSDFDELRNLILINANNLTQIGLYPRSIRTNPLIADVDGDGLNDSEEIQRGLDPENFDTDGDGIIDFEDNFNGTLPITNNVDMRVLDEKKLAISGSYLALLPSKITSVVVNWGDGNNDTAWTGTALQAEFNISHNYNNAATFPVSIVVNTTDAGSFTYDGSVEFQAKVSNNFYQNWNTQSNSHGLYDVNNDGHPDIVGFGDNDVMVSLWDQAGKTFQTPVSWLAGRMVVNDTSVSNRYPDIYQSPRFVEDWNDDGFLDLIGFSTAGVEVALNNSGTGFEIPTMVTTDFGTDSGWNPLIHLRMIADVDGNGRPDIVGFGGAGIAVFRNGVNASGQSVFAFDDFGYDNGWRIGDHYRLVHDIDGDGRADILAFSAQSIVALGNTDGTFTIALDNNGVTLNPIPGIRTNPGWNPLRLPIKFADMNNDGKDDVVAFGASGILVYLNQSTPGSIQFEPSQFWSSDFGESTGGWRHTYSSSFIDFGKVVPVIKVKVNPRYLKDINGDGFPDMVGFGTEGVLMSLSNYPQQKNLSNNIDVLSNNFFADFSTSFPDWSDVEPNTGFWGNLFGNKHFEPSISSPECIPIIAFGITVGCNVIPGKLRIYADRYAEDLDGDGIVDLVGFPPGLGLIWQLSPRVTPLVQTSP